MPIIMKLLRRLGYAGFVRLSHDNKGKTHNWQMHMQVSAMLSYSNLKMLPNT